jgi:hypothetical protein
MTGEFLAAQVSDPSVSFDAEPVATPGGPVLWATVNITYLSEGTAPSVSIRVPLPWSGRDSAEEQKSEALRRARQLIDHACEASGMGGPASREAPADPPGTLLEGLSQELGIALPTTKPVRTLPDAV